MLKDLVQVRCSQLQQEVCHVSGAVPFVRATLGVRGNAACDGQIGVA